MASKTPGKRPSWLRRSFAVAAFAAAGAGAPLPVLAQDNSKKQDLQEEINDYLSQYDGKHPHSDRAIVVDPARVDRKLAEGLNPWHATAAVLKEEGLELKEGSTLPAAVADRLYAPETTEAGNVVFVVNPATLPLQEERVCLIVAAPAGGGSTTVDPLRKIGAQTLAEFVNRHEAWHCKDSGRHPMEPGKADVIETLLPPGAYLRQQLAVDRLTALYRAETFADVAATGDMVRAGHGPGLIDDIALWRQSLAEDDPLHLSTPALMELKSRITKMGVEAFRAMDAGAAETAYRDITQKNGLTAPEAMNFFIQLQAGSPERVEQVRAAAAGGHVAARNALHIHALQQWAERYGKVPPPMTEAARAQEAAAGARLRAWDAVAALYDRAQKDSGATEPPALHKAYDSMMREAEQEMRRTPQDPLAREKATKLRTAFISAALGVHLLEKNDGGGYFLLPRARPGVKAESWP